ncbi:MAG: glycosyltransferase [Phormidesmis sp.]
MRKLLYLLPGTTKRFFTGGLTAELKTLKLAQQICEADVVTYRQREQDTPFLDEVLVDSRYQDCIFVLSWGFDVPKLFKRIGDRPTIYHAHSTGYGFRVPPRVPIITVSRNSMGYWGEKALSSLIYYLPNEISPAFENQHLTRDIDVLVQARKSSEYLLKQLVPALQPQCNVVVQDSYVDDLIGLFNRSKIYLYDTAEYWGRYHLTEGFGLPPMEALACGMQVFSSVNHALADYLDPGFNCHNISFYATGYDVQRILNVLNSWENQTELPADFLAPYTAQQLIPRLQTILQEVNHFFDYQQTAASDVPQLTVRRRLSLNAKRILHKVKAKIKK